MRTLILFLSFIWTASTAVFAQYLPGKLLLVGGGTENPGKWSDAPYKWAIEKSSNKRVAIITYEANPSAWLPGYFTSLGAQYARNFSITTQTQANLQQTYDSLITYSVIFFKGGDQKYYYNLLRNTLARQAIQHVFENGGVIGGTSAGAMVLSGVVFAALNGSVYSDEALANPNNQYMTLRDDFLNLLSGFIFDTHFLERARFGRLMGFLGHWKLNKGEDIIGIGVDDKTAFAIDADGTGYAFGTGAVNIYRAMPDNQFSLGGTRLLATAIGVTQLLHNTRINLSTWEVSGYTSVINPRFEDEIHDGTILMSGSDDLNKNQLFLERFAELTSRDSVLIFTGTNTQMANQIRSYLLQNNVGAEVVQIIPANFHSSVLKQKIARVKNFLFTGNDFNTLKAFISEGEAGILLWQKLRSGGCITGFIGGDSRCAGATVLVNYDQPYASYDGLLDFQKGLGLLRTTIIMPNTFQVQNIEENAAAGVPFGMLLDSLKYGIWIFGNTYAEYRVNPQRQTIITSRGSYPMIFIESTGTYGGFSDQSAVSSGRPRHVAGFHHMTITLMDESMSKIVGYASSQNESMLADTWKVFPNPFADQLYFEPPGNERYHLKIVNSQYQKVFEAEIEGSTTFDLSFLRPGFYLIQLFNSDISRVYSTRVIKLSLR